MCLISQIRSDELRKWFIQMEVDLFRIRLNVGTFSALEPMIREHELPFVKANVRLISKVLMYHKLYNYYHIYIIKFLFEISNCFLTGARDQKFYQ